MEVSIPELPSVDPPSVDPPSVNSPSLQVVERSYYETYDRVRTQFEGIEALRDGTCHNARQQLKKSPQLQILCRPLVLPRKRAACPSRDCWNFLHAAGLHARSLFTKPRNSVSFWL